MAGRGRRRRVDSSSRGSESLIRNHSSNSSSSSRRRRSISNYTVHDQIQNVEIEESSSSSTKSSSSSSFKEKCSHMAKKQRAKFYILRRCITMLICWHERNDP
ncbi:hypothetical protein M9H77_24597 [Catharanthus roseus]|uniref:Uncharacterized protein n=1 Tax=Catharanthus roseus TaxID=4058 RepID=A0ACC0AWL8_CATRO|nr:hypothetical protein M9H77_24597 [Catharanthus roseus]